MKIAIAQLATTGPDLMAGAERIVAESRMAAERGASLMVVPYATLAGPQAPDTANEAAYLTDLATAFAHLAHETALPCIVPVPSEATPEAEPAVFLLERPAADWQGSLLTQAEGEVEVGRGQPCGGCTRFVLDGARFAVACTYEELEALRDAGTGIDVVIFASAYGFALDDPNSAMGPALTEARFVDDAQALEAWVVGAASLGGYGTYVYTGGSFVLSPAGELVASAASFEEELLVAELEPGERRAGAPGQQFEIFNRTMHLWEALAIGMRDYAHKQGATDVALALDGTLSSSVVCALAVDAVGPTHVRALVADDPLAPAGTGLAAARQLAHDLRVEATEAALDADALSDAAWYHDLTQACLARLARATGAVPLDVRDKTAFALELTQAYATCAQLAPLGDVYRSDVRELAHMRNTVSPVLPPHALSSFAAPALDALEAAGQSVELAVRQADMALLDHVEWARPLSEVADRQGPAVAAAVIGRMRKTEGARFAAVPCLMVSTRTLFDARMPLALPWSDHVRTDEERLAQHAMSAYLRASEAGARTAPAASAADDGAIDADAAAVASAFAALSGELGGLPVPEGIEAADFEQTVTSLFSLLQDMAESGSLTPDGPMSPLTFGSPFSEN